MRNKIERSLTGPKIKLRLRRITQIAESISSGFEEPKKKVI